MNRSFIFFISLFLACQTGCSSLFNPDKTISTALASYFSDSDAATMEMEKQLNSVVNETSRSITDQTRPVTEQRASENGLSLEVTDLPTGSLPDGRSSIKPFPEGNFVTTEPVPTPGNPGSRNATNRGSSWAKIEQAIEVEPQAIGRSHIRQSQFLPRHRRNKARQEANKVEAEQEKLIEIYDEINRQDIPKNYQPIPPLIQRPLLFHDSIVEPPLKSLSGSNDEVPLSDISWKDSLEATIAHLKEELQSLTPESIEADKLQKCLNVLNSVETDGKLVDLVNKLTALKSTLPQHQYEAIRQIIDSTDNSKSNLIDQLKSAVSEVSKSAELEIRNATFCTAVEGFGKFERFPSNQFHAGDEVLLYCELENFEQEKQTGSDNKTTNQCHLDAQVEFLDDKDATVFVESFANIQDESKSDRKDFYLFFRFHIPKLLPGSHKVQIRFHDKIGRKHATLDRPLTFTVVR